jgi:hypothetical protein
MTTRSRRGIWSSYEYRERARVAHAVAHDELVASRPVAESTDLPRSEKNVVGQPEGGSGS